MTALWGTPALSSGRPSPTTALSLIEVKPDPDMGSVRIAIGQLLDYRRFLPHRAGTDLALLTISRPQKTFLDLLFDLQISALWFDDGHCQKISGEGKAWEGLQAAFRVPVELSF